MEVRGQPQTPASLSLGKRLGRQCVGGRVGPTVALDVFKKNRAVNVRITLHWNAILQPLLQWKSSKCYIFWLRVCGLGYPACDAHAPYCHPWSVRLHNIPHYLINGTILGRKLLNINVFRFSLHLPQILIFLRNEQHMIINVRRYSCKVPLFLSDVNEFWIFSTGFSKDTQKSIFMKIRPVGA